MGKQDNYVDKVHNFVDKAWTMWISLKSCTGCEAELFLSVGKSDVFHRFEEKKWTDVQLDDGSRCIICFVEMLLRSETKDEDQLVQHVLSETVPGICFGLFGSENCGGCVGMIRYLLSPRDVDDDEEIMKLNVAQVFESEQNLAVDF